MRKFQNTKVTFLPVIIGTLRTILKIPGNRLEELEIKGKVSNLKFFLEVVKADNLTQQNTARS